MGITKPRRSVKLTSGKKVGKSDEGKVQDEEDKVRKAKVNAWKSGQKSKTGGKRLCKANGKEPIEHEGKRCQFM